MKRQVHVEYADATPRVQAIYDEIRNVTGAPDVPNVFKSLGKNENALFAAWTQLRFTVLTGDVPMLLKQLILFNISARARNEYCTALHGNLALNLDRTLTCDELLRMSRGDVIDHLPRSSQAAIETITKVAFEGESVAAGELPLESRLRDEGFSEREVDELLSLASLGTMMNTITNIFEIPVDQPFPPPE
jgi:alkylhydroperoxidase family enzyme